jgi:leucyl-tRNA synthetase
MAYNFTTIEKKWQQYWLEHNSFRALDPADAGKMPKAYVLDMFPYPSGAGLHVGHPEGYTATDIVSRYLRMKGFNVLHPMGWDAFGLPAEQYAIKTNTHPRTTTEQNIANFRRQIQMLGLSYDWDREVDTTDPTYYKWTQWIFLQIFNSYFDPIDQKAKPIGHLMQELLNENFVVAPDLTIHINPVQEGMERVSGSVRVERLWRELSPEEQRDVIDAQRLAYTAEVPVNWCPGLGTVLANEEVIDGKSEVGGFPVEKRPMRQWMLRITAYADRLIKDLDLLEWPESLKEMQRNWIGKSVGAEVDFEIDAAAIASNAPSGVRAAQGSEPQVSESMKAEASAGDADLVITVFTTRPDTLYGATYMVLAPEHPLVPRITSSTHRESVEAYRTMMAGKSERDRMAETKEKTGIFTGAFAINPVNDERIPIYVADYVLMGYGTGAIMAVPAHDERDFEFAKKFELAIRAVVMPPDDWLRAASAEYFRRAQPEITVGGDPASIEKMPPGAKAFAETWTKNEQQRMAGLAGSASGDMLESLREAYRRDAGRFPTAFTGEGVAINSPLINDLRTTEAKDRIIADLAAENLARRTVKYKLRDWLFSRQRYWGEPFPIILDDEGNPYAVDENELPITLPEMADFKPTGTPEPPLSKARDWLRVESDGKAYARETNTMPQWAGSCWYYLRYIDPKNPTRFVDPAKEKYWMPVDLYVGGVEHAVLHLLYSRFWHKILFDLGHVSTSEPFLRLVNQGLILGETEYHAFQMGDMAVSAADVRDVDEEASDSGVKMVAVHKSTGERVTARRLNEEEVEKRGDGYVLKCNPSVRVDARSFKMSKSRGNVVNPDTIVRDYGADTFRLYEMYLGPLEAQKPWNTRDIVGMSRFLASVYRNLLGDDENPTGPKVVDNAPIPDALERQMHRTIKKVGDDIEALRFNTAIAELIKLNNEMGKLPAIPRPLAENFTLMLAPFAPHVAEEVWHRTGHDQSLARHPWPKYDDGKLAETSIEVPVQVNGKLRDKVTVPADADEQTVLETAERAERVRPWIDGKTIVKRLYVPGKLVNFVVK